MTKKTRVSGVGCCLVDLLYNNISFSSRSFSSYISKKRGDGGLTPGQLVFTSEFEKFSGHDFQMVIHNLTKGKPADKINMGNYFRRFFMLLYGGNLFSGYTGRETKINDPFF
jgi:hypothetical protein